MRHGEYILVALGKGYSKYEVMGIAETPLRQFTKLELYPSLSRAQTKARTTIVRILGHIADKSDRYRIQEERRPWY